MAHRSSATTFTLPLRLQIGITRTQTAVCTASIGLQLAGAVVAANCVRSRLEPRAAAAAAVGTDAASSSFS